MFVNTFWREFVAFFELLIISEMFEKKFGSIKDTFEEFDITLIIESSIFT
jgi:hypothetical protein